MSLNGYNEELNGYNTVIKNGQLPDANDVKAVVPPLGGVIDWMKTFGTADSGTTDNTVADKLEESGQNFGSTVVVGMIVHNTTDDTFSYVTGVDSNTVLSLNDDIMVSGDTYVIYTTPYLSDGWAECNGQALSDADSPYNGFTLPDLNGVIQVRAVATGTSDTTLTDTGIGWTPDEWIGYIVEITDGAGIEQSRTITGNTSEILTFVDGGDWGTAVGSTPAYIIRTTDRITIGSYKSGSSGTGGGEWHKITDAESDAHTHTYENNGGSSGSPVRGGHDDWVTATTSSSAGGDELFDNRPPWYKVVKIMRVK